ncbi:MAG: RsiV family protein, partial [Lysobacter sp.]
QQDRLLTASDLVPDARSWTPIAANVREQLLTALSQRVDADALPPAERLEVVKNASRMIEDGTEPTAATFAMFEPVTTPSGKLRALRFVFAPYQVGPYSDGTQTVEVPAAVLLPHVAPAYRELFQTGAG